MKRSHFLAALAVTVFAPPSMAQEEPTREELAAACLHLMALLQQAQMAITAKDKRIEALLISTNCA